MRNGEWWWSLFLVAWFQSGSKNKPDCSGTLLAISLFQASAIHLWTTPCAKRFELSSEQNFKEVITCGIVDFSSASIRVGAYYVYSAEAKSSERNTFALSTKKYSYDGIKFALLATILLCKCQCHYQLKHKCQILCFAEYKISKLSVNSPRMAEKMCTLSF